MADMSTLRQQLQDQIQLNQSLEEDIGEINVTIKKLKGYKSELAKEIGHSLSEKEGMVQNKLKFLIRKNQNVDGMETFHCRM